MVQEQLSENRIIIVNPLYVPLEDLKKEGAEKVKVQYLIDERHGSNRFALRLYTVEKNGRTPLDQHVYEHQVYVLKGEGVIRMHENKPVLRPIHVGDTIFIPSNAIHRFMNEKDEPLVFLCVKGNPSLYSTTESIAQGSTAETTDNSC